MCEASRVPPNQPVLSTLVWSVNATQLTITHCNTCVCSRLTETACPVMSYLHMLLIMLLVSSVMPRISLNGCLCTQASEYTRTSHLDSITIPQAPRLGTQVVEVENLSKSYGDRLLMKDLSFSVPPGSVVGELVIPNMCWTDHSAWNLSQ